MSLRRLGIDRIDLYYIHEFDRVTPLEETLDAMTRAVEAGKIDRFGVSNASLADVQEVRRVAGNSLGSRFEHVQNEYNLLATADAEALIPWCAEHGLRYTAFSPLAGGLLTGKYRLGEEPPPGSRLAHAADIYAGHLNEASFAAIEELKRSAEVRGQTMAEAALRFVLDPPGVDGLIIAPRRPEHFASYGLRPQMMPFAVRLCSGRSVCFGWKADASSACDYNRASRLAGQFLAGGETRHVRAHTRSPLATTRAPRGWSRREVEP